MGFEACSAFTHVSARVVAKPPSDLAPPLALSAVSSFVRVQRVAYRARPFYQSASIHVVTSMNHSGYYQLERQLLGGIRTRKESAPLHGTRYYDPYCYLPLYITCGDPVLSVRLRPSRIDASEGSVEELERVVARIRARWPEVKITVRGDAGFCRDQIMRWCEDNGIWYVLGLSRNPRLQRKIRRQMSKAGSRCVMLGKASRRFRDFRYRTLAGWSCKRRVVAKAEWLPGPRGYNSRFVVTNIPKVTIRAKPLYEDLYRARARWKTGSGSSSWICLPTGPRRPRCGPTSCGPASRPSPVF